MSQESETPEPYRTVGEKARFYKALVQMAIGAAGAVIVSIRLIVDIVGRGLDATHASEHLFINIGLTLGLAAVVELAYTLFTHGPDEAIDPIMLGLAAALLVQLGQVGVFDLKQGLAAMFYVIALGGLFLIRKRYANMPEPPQWSPRWWGRHGKPSGQGPNSSPGQPGGTMNDGPVIQQRSTVTDHIEPDQDSPQPAVPPRVESM
jgi:hypothetical protein